MIREICKDEEFLSQKAEPATLDDRQVAADLLETLEHHKDGCVGMAANMIGVNKRIIAFDTHILYGSADNMTSRQTVEAYIRQHNAELTVIEGGEHWFHTPEQLAALREWEETSC